MIIFVLMVFLGNFGRVECYSTESFLVITLTVVITGFLILIMLIYIMLIMQRRSSKVCYVQRTPQQLQKTIYDNSTLNSVAWARWERRRYDMRRATTAPPRTSSSNSNTLTPAGFSSMSSFRNYELKRPSTGTILPVTYVSVLPDGDFVENETPPRPIPAAALREEYIVY